MTNRVVPDSVENSAAVRKPCIKRKRRLATARRLREIKSLFSYPPRRFAPPLQWRGVAAM
ncbi:MAG: hypothetical protein K6F85_04235 [Bacteroidales bacterium]|nr:hypothetical protein [Bacteroidales bacterium]